MTKKFESDFTQFVYDGWQRVANVYDEVWSKHTRQTIDSLLNAMNISPGMRVLDIACGPGYVSKKISELGGIPTGIDFSGNMVKLAREYFPDLDFREGNAEQLEFDDNTFDAVAINFGIQQFSNPEKAISEACRVLKSNGIFGFTAWLSPDESPAAKVMDDVLKPFIQHAQSLPETPARYVFSDKNYLRTIFNTSFDLDSIKVQKTSTVWILNDANEWFDTEIKYGIRNAMILKSLPKETLITVRNKIAEEVQQFKKGNGFKLPFGACVVTVKKK